MAEKNSKIYESLVMEIRPRLQSVNVYIVLKQKSSSDIDLILNCNDFSIVLEGNVHKILCTGVNILPESLSSLQINGLHVSFRFQTNSNPQDFTGRFKAEFLQPPQLQKHIKKSVNWLKRNTNYSIFCSNCRQTFCNNVSFQRVLPLPSDHLDLSDWFCHGHNIDTNTNLNPNANDIFYTETYVHLANSLINGDVIKSDKVIVCKRCLLWLGLKVNDLVVKIWFNTVSFKSDDETYHSSPLNDVHLVTNEILSSSFLNMAKIVFHCQINNNVKNYILLWVIEKKLNLQADVSKGIKNCDVAKVLFKFEEEESPLVLEWQKESVTTAMCISKPMMVELLKHLYKINKMFPEEFRVTNGFFVSYLCLYENSLVE